MLHYVTQILQYVQLMFGKSPLNVNILSTAYDSQVEQPWQEFVFQVSLGLSLELHLSTMHGNMGMYGDVSSLNYRH